MSALARGPEDAWDVRRVNYLTTTTFTLPGFRIVENLGVVRGVVVRSRSIIGTGLATLQTVFGGNIAMFTQLCERTRGEAFDIMVRHAVEIGANAVVGVRYDANDIMRGVTEVLCYGTAVVVEEEASGRRP
jgi:uncharacterized protein YbjQ (UPF0145 family)